jgi:hypothetical protein
MDIDTMQKMITAEGIVAGAIYTPIVEYGTYYKTTTML